jgi:hypothetical protein
MLTVDRGQETREDDEMMIRFLKGKNRCAQSHYCERQVLKCGYDTFINYTIMFSTFMFTQLSTVYLISFLLAPGGELADLNF